MISLRSCLWALLAMTTACSVERGDTLDGEHAAVTRTCSVTKIIANGASIHGSNGMNFDKDGNLLVVSLIGNEIVTVDPASGAILGRQNLGDVTGAPGGPDDLVVAPDGTVYYTSLLTGWVGHLSKDLKTLLGAAFVAPGANAITLQVTGDNVVRVFVGLDFYGDGLYELDANLTTVTAIVPNTPGQFPLGFLNGFDFGPDGLLYAPSLLAGMVVSVDVHCAAGQPTFTNGCIRAVTSPSSLDVPTALKFDSKGHLYVISAGDGRVWRIADPTKGASEPKLVAQLSPALDNLAIDSDDQVFVSNGDDGSIARIVDGKVDYVVREGMILPGGVAVVDQADGSEVVYVADGQSLRQLSPISGKELGIDRSIFSTRPAPPAIPFSAPTTVSVDGANLVLSSLLVNTVQVWNPETKEVIESRTMTTAPFDAVRFQGTIAVSTYDVDPELHGKVVRLDTGETILETPWPVGLAASGNLLFVSDWAYGLVWKVDMSTGTPAPSVVAQGLDHPEGLALDGNGGLLVVESGAGRLSRIDLTTGETTTVADGLALGLTEPPPFAPQYELNGVSVSRSGDIFVTGDKRDVVYRIKPRTTCL